MNNFLLKRSLVNTNAATPPDASHRTLAVKIAVLGALSLVLLLSPFVCCNAAMITNASQKSTNKSSGNAESGKRIFENQGCNRCHGSLGEGVSNPGKNGGAPRIAQTRLPLSEFLAVVRKPKGQMPPFSAQQTSDAELTDVYAFLRSLTPPDKGQRPSSSTNTKNGEQLFTRYGCYQCHGFQGQGSIRTGGSRLGPPAIPLSAFVSYIRQPTGQMPPYTAKSVSDEELAEIYAFLQSLPQPPPSKTIPLLNQ